MTSVLIVKKYAAPSDALRVRDALAAMTRNRRNPLAGQLIIRVVGCVSPTTREILCSTGYPVEVVEEA